MKPITTAIKSLMAGKSLIMSMAVMLLALPSCLKDDEVDYTQWRQENEDYVARLEAMTNPDGTKMYTRVEPTWYPGGYILMCWHNDRAMTANGVPPLYNSTCNTVYHCSTLTEAVDSSYNLTTTAGDSIYQCRPSNVIPGYAAALMNMNPGDSCTVIIPYAMGYTDIGSGNVKPYSTLIYELKLVSISKYQLP